MTEQMPDQAPEQPEAAAPAAPPSRSRTPWIVGGAIAAIVLLLGAAGAGFAAGRATSPTINEAAGGRGAFDGDHMGGRDKGHRDGDRGRHGGQRDWDGDTWPPLPGAPPPGMPGAPQPGMPGAPLPGTPLPSATSGA